MASDVVGGKGGYTQSGTYIAPYNEAPTPGSGGGGWSTTPDVLIAKRAAFEAAGGGAAGISAALKIENPADLRGKRLSGGGSAEAERAFREALLPYSERGKQNYYLYQGQLLTGRQAYQEEATPQAKVTSKSLSFIGLMEPEHGVTRATEKETYYTILGERAFNRVVYKSPGLVDWEKSEMKGAEELANLGAEEAQRYEMAQITGLAPGAITKEMLGYGKVGQTRRVQEQFEGLKSGKTSETTISFLEGQPISSFSIEKVTQGMPSVGISFFGEEYVNAKGQPISVNPELASKGTTSIMTSADWLMGTAKQGKYDVGKFLKQEEYANVKGQPISYNPDLARIYSAPRYETREPTFDERQQMVTSQKIGMEEALIPGSSLIFDPNAYIPPTTPEENAWWRYTNLRDYAITKKESLRTGNILLDLPLDVGYDFVAAPALASWGIVSEGSRWYRGVISPPVTSRTPQEKFTALMQPKNIFAPVGFTEVLKQSLEASGTPYRYAGEKYAGRQTMAAIGDLSYATGTWIGFGELGKLGGSAGKLLKLEMKVGKELPAAYLKEAPLLRYAPIIGKPLVAASKTGVFRATGEVIGSKTAVALGGGAVTTALTGDWRKGAEAFVVGFGIMSAGDVALAMGAKGWKYIPGAIGKMEPTIFETQKTITGSKAIQEFRMSQPEEAQIAISRAMKEGDEELLKQEMGRITRGTGKPSNKLSISYKTGRILTTPEGLGAYGTEIKIGTSLVGKKGTELIYQGRLPNVFGGLEVEPMSLERALGGVSKVRYYSKVPSFEQALSGVSKVKSYPKPKWDSGYTGGKFFSKDFKPIPKTVPKDIIPGSEFKMPKGYKMAKRTPEQTESFIKDLDAGKYGWDLSTGKFSLKSVQKAAKTPKTIRGRWLSETVNLRAEMRAKPALKRIAAARAREPPLKGIASISSGAGYGAMVRNTKAMKAAAAKQYNKFYSDMGIREGLKAMESPEALARSHMGLQQLPKKVKLPIEPRKFTATSPMETEYEYSMVNAPGAPRMTTSVPKPYGTTRALTSTRLTTTPFQTLSSANIERMMQGRVSSLRQSDLTSLRQGEIQKLGQGEISRLRQGEITQLRQGEITKLRQGEISRLRMGEITRLKQPVITRIRIPYATSSAFGKTGGFKLSMPKMKETRYRMPSLYAKELGLKAYRAPKMKDISGIFARPTLVRKKRRKK